MTLLASQSVIHSLCHCNCPPLSSRAPPVIPSVVEGSLRSLHVGRDDILPCHYEYAPFVISTVVEGSKKYIMTQDEKWEKDEHDMLNWLKYAIVCH